MFISDRNCSKLDLTLEAVVHHLIWPSSQEAASASTGERTATVALVSSVVAPLSRLAAAASAVASAAGHLVGAH